MRSPRGVGVPLRKIVPNRLNPNEMDWGIRASLRDEMQNDDYDPIVISPALVFYGNDALKMDLFFNSPDGVQVRVEAKEAFIICDGQHRYEEAIEAGMTKIRALIEQLTEEEAMPWFYKRHRIRGVLNPLKEAELFWYERHVRGLSRDDIIKRYGLSGVGYLKTRLKLTNLSVSVAKLFYDPPEFARGKLTVGDLREIATLPNRMQRIVALTALERNWTSRDIEAECARVKSMKGILSPQSYVPPPGAPPPSRPEKQQHEKKMGKRPQEDWDKAAAAPDEEVFKDYSSETLKHADEPDQSIKDKLRDAATQGALAPEGTTTSPDSAPVIPESTLPGHVTYEPKVVTAPPSWEIGEKKKEEEKPAKPPLVVDRYRMDPFFEAVLLLAIDEDLDINAEAIDGKPPLEYLKGLIDEDVYLLLDKGRMDVLPRIALRALQIWVLARVSKGN